MPAYQGEFDGLCGMYAIANAYELCGGSNSDAEGAFRTACIALADSRWPAVLWTGTSLHDMMRMIKKCQAEVPGGTGADAISALSVLKKATDVGRWLLGFAEALLRQRARQVRDRAAKKKPWNHWVVISPDTERRVWFTDSDKNELEYRKNLASLHAGERRPKRTQWLIDRQALIVFEAQG